MEASPAPAWPASGSCSHLGLRASREGTPRNPRLGVCVMGAGGRREDGVPGLSWVSHLPCRGPGCKLSSVPLAGGGPRSWCQDVLGSTPPPPQPPTAGQASSLSHVTSLGYSWFQGSMRARSPDAGTQLCGCVQGGWLQLCFARPQASGRWVSTQDTQDGLLPL